MCGIVIGLTTAEHDTPEYRLQLAHLQLLNTSRGPDAQKTINILVEGTETISISAFASVLHLRGETVTTQPHGAVADGSAGDFFCWNGEVFEGMEIQPSENDGVKVFESLRAGKSLVSVMGCIESPYAFVYYQRVTRHLYFARDPLGRRSLLVHQPTAKEPYLIIASASSGTHLDHPSFEEVSTDGIHCLRLDDFTTLEDGRTFGFPTTIVLRREADKNRERVDWTSVAPLNAVLPPSNLGITDWASPPGHLKNTIDAFSSVLDQAVRLRVQHIPLLKTASSNGTRVGILFSGGIDCSVLAFLAHQHLPLDEPIDLLNVAFENPRTLKASSSARQTSLRKNAENGKTDAMIGETEPKTSLPTAGTGVYHVPDRLTGLEELEELRRICSNRIWNFVEIDVPYDECQRERPKVEALMYPNRTVMDLSLALALYFASRGIGTVRSSPDAQPAPYTSRARVLLSGLGSDELLGGYARHRQAFAKHGWQGLVDELQLDLTRLPSRNLGRDDRVISANAKEARYPYLSLTFLSFVAALPVELKTDPRLPEGMGDKMLLRMTAEKMGLVLASRRRKRAMQFGSRSARMEGGEGDRKGDVALY